MTTAPQVSQAPVAFSAALRVWAKIGLLGFGGPAGQIALMHQELVERRKWIDEARFLHALNYCMLLPGPEAQQLAVYVGWLMHKTRGGLAAGLLFVLPGFVMILGLSLLYAGYGQLPAVAAVFYGLKAAVLSVVVEAVLRIGKRALNRGFLVAIAAAAFVAIYCFGVAFPWLVLCAGGIGLTIRWLRPTGFVGSARSAPSSNTHETVIDQMAAAGHLTHTQPSWGRASRVLITCALLWVVPLLLLRSIFGADSVFVAAHVFFSKAAVVTFGGAYAVLAYIAQRSVETYGWLQPGEMLDGLGLAETTPGPLILVVQFVGFMGAFRHPGELSPLLAGVLGASVTVWVTFVPCFLWIFLGAPFIETLRGNRALQVALSCITAAVVGVILNLSVWFGLHVLFQETWQLQAGPLRMLLPRLASVDVSALLLAVLAMVSLFRVKLGLPKTLALSAVSGALLRWWQTRA